MVTVSPWHFVLVVLAGWVHREQLKVIEYLKTENRACVSSSAIGVFASQMSSGVALP
jgi:hypothetical protein